VEFYLLQRDITMEYNGMYAEEIPFIKIAPFLSSSLSPPLTPEVNVLLLAPS
jgi:hypothetical protein